jgi:Na+/glutamate symporter
MDIDYDFWITVIIGTVGGGIFGPLIVKWLQKKGWLKDDPKHSNDKN